MILSMCHYLRINPLITTLATMEIVRGLAFIVSHGHQRGADKGKELGRDFHLVEAHLAQGQEKLTIWYIYRSLGRKL